MSAEAAALPAGFKDMAGDRVHAKAFTMSKGFLGANTVLVAGAGEGAFERRLLDSGWSYPELISAIDIDPSGYKVPQVKCQKADLNESIPFSDGKFGLMYALEVIEHLHNPKRLITEAHRVLNSSGVLVLSTPNVHSLTQKVRYLFSDKLAWFHEEDYRDSGHIYPIFDWVLERLCRGLFTRLKYDSNSFHLRVIPRLPAIPMPKHRFFAVNNIYVLRKI